MTLTTLVIYLCIQVLICAYLSRKIKTESDYLVAGQKFPLFVVSISLFATWFGAETCIGSSGAVYAEGLSGARVDPFGYSMCLFLSGFLIAGKLWSRNYMTISDFFKDRFGTTTERLGVLILALSSLLWASAQLRAFGQVVSATTQLNIEVTLIICLLFVLGYTLLGGLMGDMITDVVQAFVIALGLITITVSVVLNTPDLLGTLQSIPADRLSFKGEDESWLKRIDRWAIPILGSLVVQEIVARIFSARTKKIAVTACYTGGFIYLGLGMMPVFVGMIGPELIDIEGDSEQFLILLAQDLLPPVLVGVFAGALISAMLATTDSILLSVSALVGHNFLAPLLGIKKDAHKLKLSRLLVLISGVIAYLLAVRAERIYDLLEMASSFGTAGILVVTLFGLWTNLGDQKAAITAILLGLISTPVAAYILKLDSPFLFSILMALISFLTLSILYKKEIRHSL